MRPFVYVRPRTVGEAVSRMTESSAKRPRFLGGGTTLLDLMKINVEAPDEIIDVTGIRGLDDIGLSGDGELVLGSLARMSDVAANPTVSQSFPALSESLWRAASQQLRNMATVGGNLLQRTRCAYFRSTEYPCNKRDPGSGCSALDGVNRSHAILGGSPHCIAVYPSDWAIALSAFDASITAVGPGGTRAISIHDLFLQPGSSPQRETTLRHSELITDIRVPATSLGAGSTYQKVRDRESYAFALTSAAVAIALHNGIIDEARIALGGVATVPWRARAAEERLVGAAPTQSSFRAAAEWAFEEASTTPQNAFRVTLGIETIVEAASIATARTRA